MVKWDFVWFMFGFKSKYKQKTLPLSRVLLQ